MSQTLEKLRDIRTRPFNWHELIEVCDEIEKELERLEVIDKLQEQLGCPLEVVFKALKNGFYIENHFELGNVFLNNSNENIGLEYYENHNYCCYGITWGGTDICFTKDYKKTWWLKKDKSE